ncbi:MAG: AAA family ATPase [Candidatus Micrarchaeota archaeon]
MRIIITGTPGTGKSIIAKKLADELNLELIDIKKLVLAKKLRNKKHEVDIKKLAQNLKFLKTKKDYVVEGHLACELFLPNDFVVVLRTNPKVLKKRLEKRKYSKRKTQENLAVEILDYCTQRVMMFYKRKPLELDTSQRSLQSNILEIKKAIKQKKKKIDCVDYSGFIIEGY